MTQFPKKTLCLFLVATQQEQEIYNFETSLMFQGHLKFLFFHELIICEVL